jgi:O-antigen/teichoic acid export membrane protein
MIIHLGFFSAVSLVFFFKYLRNMFWISRLKEYKSRLTAFFKYSLVTGIGTALTSISLHIFTVVLGKYADIKSVGHFSLVRSTVEPANYLYRIVGMVNFPRIAYIYGSGNITSLKNFVRDNFKKFFVFASLIFLPAVLLTPYFSKLLFKEENTSGLILLFALMLLTLYLRTIGVFHLNFLSATRYPHIPNLISPAGIFIVIPFIPLVFNSYGTGGLGVLIFTAEVVRSACIITLGEKKLVEIEKK